MLTFLRKLRKSILGTSAVSPTGRYILYAIGEIILVVIGILIALQINNWNEGRKQSIVEQQYIANLLSDLEGQTDVCQRLIRMENRKYDWADSALQILQGEYWYTQLEELDYLLEQLVPRTTFTPYNATFEDLKSSGNLKTNQVTYYTNDEINAIPLIFYEKARWAVPN